MPPSLRLTTLSAGVCRRCASACTESRARWSSALQEKVRSTIQKRDAKGVVRHGAEWLLLWADPDSMKSGAELQQELAQRNEALKIEQRLAAAARSLSGDPAMQIDFTQ